MRPNIGQFIVAVVLAVALPFSLYGQGFERVSLGADGVVWSVPELDSFSLELVGMDGTEVHEVDETVLFGVRPFLRFGLTRRFALELSHEFAFGDDVDIMVSSGTGIWRPVQESGLELHASICYGQFDWGGPGTFDSTWGWEAGAGYSFKLSDSASLVVGVAYRDLSFDYDVDRLRSEFEEARAEEIEELREEIEIEAARAGEEGELAGLAEMPPGVPVVNLPKGGSVDSGGVVVGVGLFVTF